MAAAAEWNYLGEESFHRRLFEWNADLNLEKYLPLIQPSPALFAALAALAAVYLLAAGLTLREKEKSGGE